jgi:hypothetical protein
VILEMYAQGNILLTDHNYKIMIILRPVVEVRFLFAASFFFLFVFCVYSARALYESLGSRAVGGG